MAAEIKLHATKAGHGSSPRPACLFFMHVPKTAGTTLSAHLDNQFGPGDIWHIQTYDLLNHGHPDQLAHRKFVRGHFHHDFTRLLPQPLAIITVLREPVAHVVSHYNHLVQLQEHYPEQFRVAGRSLGELLDIPLFLPVFTNVQTNMLGGPLPMGYLRDTKVNDIWISRFEAVLSEPTDPTDPRAILERAKANVSSFDCVGTAERFSEFLWMLSYRFGWEPIADSVRDNRSTNGLTVAMLDAETREKVEAITALDRELYEHAKAVSRDQYRAMMEDLLHERAQKSAADRAVTPRLGQKTA